MAPAWTKTILLAACKAAVVSIFAASRNSWGGGRRAFFLAALLLLLLADGNARAQNGAQCPGGGYNPTPTVVEVTDVPIVAASSTADYFVLYVRHNRDADTTVNIPVLVALGEAGTTTLADNLAPLPPERYLVEKYLVADPADVDGDCIDDITELADPAGKNPVNPAPAVDLNDGVVAIPDRATFETLSYQGRNTFDLHLDGLEFVKFILFDMHTDHPSVYFMNSQTHKTHISFAKATDFQGAYGLGSMRGEIIYHPNVTAPDGSMGVYRYEFEPWDDYPFYDVAYSYEVLSASMALLENNLMYYPMPRYALPLYHQEKALYDDSRINLLFEEEVFAGIDYIALNQGDSYGLLRVMSREERPNPRDVVIYTSLPNNLPLVAGIITTVPQTPLSHVNLRARQNQFPNAFIRNALDSENIADLVGHYVYYKVVRNEYTIRAATPAEVEAHYPYRTSRPATAQIPERDLSVTEITPLSEIGFDDWGSFGVKAANVAVLGKLGFPEGTVPDGFAIPFYFYDEFMKTHGFYDDVREMLADPGFQTDFEIQEDMLDDLRDDIKDAATPQWMIDALTAMHDTYPDPAVQSLRYRSSTNNEDLPKFSGAGLYDSKTQHPEETEDDGIDKSMKQVFASLWTFRAFVEREFHRVDHLATAMGVLVHPNYSDELSNGVAVSFDPVGENDGYYYLNTQVGEDLVTNPEDLSLPEEILLRKDGGGYSILVTSNQVPPGQLLLSDAQLEQLRGHLAVIHDHFEGLYNPPPGEPFAMEIEFKITSDNILAIKQARPWIFNATTTSPQPTPQPTPQTQTQTQPTPQPTPQTTPQSPTQTQTTPTTPEEPSEPPSGGEGTGGCAIAGAGNTHESTAFNLFLVISALFLAISAHKAPKSTLSLEFRE